MGGELRVDGVLCGQELLSASKIRDVAVDLAGVDRIPGLAVDLRALDLAIPIGPFDQADHETVLAAPGQIDQVVEDEGAALLVGLDDNPNAIPPSKIRVEGQV